MSKEQQAFNNLFAYNYCDGVFTGDGEILPYSQKDEERDWEIIHKALEDLEIYKKALNIVNTQFGRGYKDSYYLDQARKELENGK